MRPVHVLAVVAALGLAAPAAAAPKDLSFAALDTVTAAGHLRPAGFFIKLYKNIYAKARKHFDIDARVRSHPKIRGNLAEAEASANAVGRNSFSQTLTAADVVSGKYSASFSESVAASSHGAKAKIRRHRKKR